MLKKTITYEDLNGETVSEDYFFHLSKAELIELEMSHQGGLSMWLQAVVSAEDGASIIREFKKIILSAYGQRSNDGKRFVKTQELRDEFESTEAYSALFVELVTNTNSAIEFVNGVIPRGMVEEAAKLVTEKPKPEPAERERVVLVRPDTEPRIITRAEIEEMSHEELAGLGARITAGEVKLADS
jgi:hypothetical protein